MITRPTPRYATYDSLGTLPENNGEIPVAPKGVGPL